MSIKGFSDTSMLKNVLLLIPNETSIKNSKICLIYKKKYSKFSRILCIRRKYFHSFSVPVSCNEINSSNDISIQTFYIYLQLFKGKTNPSWENFL